MTLDHYCEQFAHLRRSPNQVFPATTKRMAPHKPLLLLAVMEMVSRGQMATRFISITGELTELTTLFTGYWRCLMPATQTSSIAFPFSRLHSEPFWELVPLPERQGGGGATALDELLPVVTAGAVVVAAAGAVPGGVTAL